MLRNTASKTVTTSKVNSDFHLKCWQFIVILNLSFWIFLSFTYFSNTLRNRKLKKVLLVKPKNTVSTPDISLVKNSSGFQYDFMRSKNRSGVSIVLGIPTIKREKESYLMKTLKNLVDNMNVTEAEDVLIVVFVAETDLEYIEITAKQIETEFPEYVESGMIEIISPRRRYPDFSKLANNLGDKHETVVWRSKQNLDYAILMSYAHSKGTFYVQLEDDIITTMNYISYMKEFAMHKIGSDSTWRVIDFSGIGFIGKLIKSVDLPDFAEFIRKRYHSNPVDWLLFEYADTYVCDNLQLKKKDNCSKTRDEALVLCNFTLFHHIGRHSSLKGRLHDLFKSR